MTHESIGVVGAGLVGCLAALAFSNKGYKVKLFDLRSDPRLQKDQRNLRSINLAVSDRGIRALKSVDEAMAERILQHVIPMKGRMIHDVTGIKQESQIYGLFGESINSIDRSFLNSCLLDELDKIDVEVFFGHKLVEVSNIAGGMETPKLTFLHESERREFEFDYVIGADGAHSQFRYQMQKYMRMDFSQKYIDMQYMELSIPAVKDADPQTNARFSLDPNHLHIWPRKDYMLIALANGDGSFTSTFFSPWGVIESISSATEFLQFFKNSFPNAYDLIGEDGLRYAFEHQPRGPLIQVSASPYASSDDRAIIIGDAAHSMVPFYGQGMNCGFEDVNVLTQLLDKNQGNLSVAFHEYTAERKQDLDTICKLALDNYYEMSTKVTDPFYLLRKKIDYYLGKYANDVLFPWVPMYSMISFRGDIRYSEAVARERRQTKVLNCIQYITLGGFAIAGLAKAAQLYQKYKR